MPTIKFTATPELPFDIAYLGYKAGDVLEMSDASARRWVRRGVAVYYTGVPQRRLDVEIAEAELTANEVREELGLPEIPIALDPVLMPESAPFPTGGVTTSWSEEPAKVDESEPLQASEPFMPTSDLIKAAQDSEDESPKRRGRKAKVASDD